MHGLAFWGAGVGEASARQNCAWIVPPSPTQGRSPRMQRDVQSLMVLVALELHHTQVAPSRLVLLGWKPSSDIL